MGIDLEHPRRAADPQTLGQTRDNAHDELHRGALTVKDRAMGFREIAVAGDALQLPPGLAAGMPVRPDIAAAEPAAVRTIRSGTAMRPRLDSPPTASGKGDHGRGCAWRRGAFVGSLHTRCTQW